MESSIINKDIDDIKSTSMSYSQLDDQDESVDDYSASYKIRHLPIANVSRIMKNSLDSNTKISKDSKEAVQKCVTEFISFITCEACERCKLEQRKTIIGDDILYALEIFGLSEYVNILKLYLAKYREMELEELEQEKKMAS